MGRITVSVDIDATPTAVWAVLESIERFTWDERLRFPWYLAGPLGEVLGGPIVMKPMWKRNLRRLKPQIESAPRSGTSQSAS